MARMTQSSQLKRHSKKIPLNKLVLIYCNGETETSYFQALCDDERLKEVKVRVVNSKSNRLSLVKEVAGKLDFKPDDHHEVWVVFDVDSKPDGQQINTCKINEEADKAVVKCRGLKYKPIVSNDCFELWFYLHFDFCESDLHRRQLLDKVEAKIPGYKKGKSVYKQLQEQTEQALRNAKKLCEKHQGYPDQYQVSQCKPFTNAHELVLRLRELIDRK